MTKREFFLVTLSCGGSSSENCTYLVQSSATTISTPCTYKICQCNTNICRMRFDFQVNQMCLACLTFLICLPCLTFLICLSCLTFLICLSCLTFLICLSCLSCLSCLTCLHCLTCLSCLTCLTALLLLLLSNFCLTFV
jgi:hypothetical protein